MSDYPPPTRSHTTVMSFTNPGATPAASNGPQRPHLVTRYTNMLLALDHIPRVHNLLASFFTWILLAGFVLFPGTFASLGEVEGQGAEVQVLHAIQHISLFVIAWVCTGIGAIGMIWLWWRWKDNYVWLVNRIFMPGLLNSVAGIVSTITSVFGAQHGRFTAASTTTIIVTAATAGVCGGLAVAYTIWGIGRVRKQHENEVGREKTGRHGRGVLDMSWLKSSSAVKSSPGDLEAGRSESEPERPRGSVGAQPQRPNKAPAFGAEQHTSQVDRPRRIAEQQTSEQRRPKGDAEVQTEEPNEDLAAGTEQQMGQRDGSRVIAGVQTEELHEAPSFEAEQQMGEIERSRVIAGVQTEELYEAPDFEDEEEMDELNEPGEIAEEQPEELYEAPEFENEEQMDELDEPGEIVEESPETSLCETPDFQDDEQTTNTTYRSGLQRSHTY
ncbi:hypothetical protein PLICRDRAFT_44704 [Plicaturopsis crispa FD-325 SS-3]|nr:hypothetical protein PLICRDRAFT_44704 [Plicaturopsis crispa FD-325 SS-3]